MRWAPPPCLPALTLSLLALAACGGVERRDAPRPCGLEQPAAFLPAAERSLVVVRYQVTARYDVGADQATVPVATSPAPDDALAVLSWPAPERFADGVPEGFERLGTRSYTYDDALYVLWQTRKGRQAPSRRALHTLASLQRADGAWGFSFTPRGDGFYNAGYVRAGVVAWVVYAAARYTERFGDRRFVEMARRGGRWLLERQAAARGVDPAMTGLVLAGLGRWVDDNRFEPGYEARFAATEHQVDAWFALRALARVDADGPWRAALEGPEGLEQALDGALAADHGGRAWQGRSATGPDEGSALDAAGSWSALLALARGDGDRARRMLGWVERHHALTDAGVRGYRPYRAGPDLVFVEGGVAVGMAAARAGDRALARRVFADLAALACRDGLPLPYASRRAPDFPRSPAAAPTLWALFLADELGEGGPWLWSGAP